MVDIEKLKSHPNKTLLTHVNGVISRTKALTTSKFAELGAIFHDLGKMNLGFQIKVYPTIEKDLGIKITEADKRYSNHAYLSAYAFWCYYLMNGSELREYFGKDISQNELLALVIIIAKHHGNLPNFFPTDITNEKEQVFNKYEIGRLFKYLEISKVSFDEYPKIFNLPSNNYSNLLCNPKAERMFINLSLDKKSHSNYLDFYQETQFSFASLIQADKKDAGYIDTNDKENIKEFCGKYYSLFNSYLDTLKPYQCKKINQLRTKIRNEATINISKYLKEGNSRVFDLTAPTGSGKTLSLLSLSNEIIKHKGSFRIMYCLPFLSITEQVEKEVLKIFKEQEHLIQRIDSKSINNEIQRLQEELDNNPSKLKFKELGVSQFQENIFEYPFIITTFVKFFEAFLKNQNADLLKLPSFSNCIFLIDEIQALPPRLYGFFVAYLDAFCEKFNSYAIISTATMPNFKLPTDDIKSFFPNYQEPPSLLSKGYFKDELFNRYKIEHQKEEINISHLANMIINENKSVLCIVNTIDDSKDLFEKLNEFLDGQEICLLNTHFTPNDRKRKINYANLRLKENQRIVLVSTQLIEAGVDIDFPVLYRDMAIIPSIVQSAGRCNRNGKLNKGKVVIFNLKNRGRLRSRLIYRGRDSNLLFYTKRILKNTFYQENELFIEQEKYFSKIGEDLVFGQHEQRGETLNFIELIKEAMFSTLGSFKLIDDDYFGNAYRIYVPKSCLDNNFIKLDKMVKELECVEYGNWEALKILKGKISILIKQMSGQIVQIRLKKGEVKPNFMGLEVYGINLLDIGDYSYIRGVNLSIDNQII